PRPPPPSEQPPNIRKVQPDIAHCQSNFSRRGGSGASNALRYLAWRHLRGLRAEVQKRSPVSAADLRDDAHLPIAHADDLHWGRGMIVVVHRIGSAEQRRHLGGFERALDV